MFVFLFVRFPAHSRVRCWSATPATGREKSCSQDSNCPCECISASPLMSLTSVLRSLCSGGFLHKGVPWPPGCPVVPPGTARSFLKSQMEGSALPPPIQQAPGLSLGASSYCRSSPPTTRCSLPPGPPRPRRSTPAAPRGALACCPVLPSLPHHLSIPSLLSPPHASPPPPLPSRLLLKTVRTPRGIGGMGRAFPTPLSPLPHHIPYWFPHSLTGTRMALFTCLCLHPVNRQKRKTEHTVFS